MLGALQRSNEKTVLSRRSYKLSIKKGQQENERGGNKKEQKVSICLCGRHLSQHPSSAAAVKPFWVLQQLGFKQGLESYQRCKIMAVPRANLPGANKRENIQRLVNPAGEDWMERSPTVIKQFVSTLIVLKRQQKL